MSEQPITATPISTDEPEVLTNFVRWLLGDGQPNRYPSPIADEYLRVFADGSIKLEPSGREYNVHVLPAGEMERLREFAICDAVIAAQTDRSTGLADASICENPRPCADHPPDLAFNLQGQVEGSEEALAITRADVERQTTLIAEIEAYVLYYEKDNGTMPEDDHAAASTALREIRELIDQHRLKENV